MTADELTSIRQKLGLTQDEYADHLNCSRSSLYYWENNKRPVPDEVAENAKGLLNELPTPLTGRNLRALRKRLNLHAAAFGPLIDRAHSSVNRYEGEYEDTKGTTADDPLPAEVARAVAKLQSEHSPMSAQRYAHLTAQRLLPEMNDEKASELAGETCRLLPFCSDPDSTIRSLYAVGKSGAVYTLRPSGCTIVQGKRIGGAWKCKKRSTKNNQVVFRRNGNDTAMTHQRAIALAWLGEPPFESAESYLLDDEKPPAANNVGWRSKYERWQEYVNSTKKNDNGRPDTKVFISNAVSAKIHDKHSQQIREHGITYVIDCLLRDQLGLERAPTPHERKTGKEPHTKAARVLLAARKNPEMTAPELAEAADTTPAYARRVLDTNHVSLRELRRKKEMNKALKKAKRRNRDKNILTEAKSGLFTLRQLSEKYELSEQQIQAILRKENVSLAAAKRRKRKELQKQLKKNREK